MSKKSKAKHNVIWKSYGMLEPNEIEDMKKYARERLEEWAEETEEVTDSMVEQQVWEDIDLFYDDEVHNLSKQLEGRVIAIADIGRWDGRVQGYQVLDNNLSSVVTCNISCDEKEIYCDAYNVRATGYHHDGRNHILYRELREDRDVDKFLDKIYNQETISSRTLSYYTKSLRPYVQEVYGF